MEFIATQKLTRQSSRKIRLVANQVKKLALPDMLRQLAVIERKSTLVLLKTLKQAIANAQNNHGVAFESLELKELLVNDGPSYKRFQPVSRGRAHRILKRTSNIRVVLREKSGAVSTPVKKSEANVASVGKESEVQVTSDEKIAEIKAKTSATKVVSNKPVIAQQKVTQVTPKAVKRTTTNRTTNK